MNANNRPTHAHVSLVRLGGVNEKVPVTYQGASVFVPNPQAGFEGRPGHCYRLKAAPFIAGESQYRSDWSIRRWDDKSERAAQAESNWQT